MSRGLAPRLRESFTHKELGASCRSAAAPSRATCQSGLTCNSTGSEGVDERQGCESGAAKSTSCVGSRRGFLSSVVMLCLCDVYSMWYKRWGNESRMLSGKRGGPWAQEISVIVHVSFPEFAMNNLGNRQFNRETTITSAHISVEYNDESGEFRRHRHQSRDHRTPLSRWASRKSSMPHESA
jgi:hypothetical protein